MNKMKIGVVALVIALALSSFGIALADSHDDPPPPEEEGFIHPVIALMAEYFGSVSDEDQDAAKGVLGTTEENPIDHVEYDPETGIYTVFYADETFVEFDETLADPDTLAALDTLVQAETGVDTLYAQIEEYHSTGHGLGVIVKFLSMAESGDVTVEQLMEAFDSGEGVGQLMKTYGRPEIMGIGHIRQAMKDGESGPSAFSTGSGNNGNHGGGNNGEHGPPAHSNAGGNGGGNGPPDHANNDKDKDD